MKKKYQIGRFEFDSYKEYKRGLEDVKKIKCISDELDINEPGVALRLYTLIRQEDIRFQSVIGEDYLLYLSDLVANDFKELSQESTETQKAEEKQLSTRKMIGIGCIVLASICFIYFLGSEYISIRKAREAKAMQEEKEISKTALVIADLISKGLDAEKVSKTGENGENVQEIPVEEREILPEYVELHQENPDLVGWIKIPETEVDYPVMQTTDSNEYYLKHNFEKKEDKNGSIFMDMRNNYIQRDHNLMIYGHNMKTGAMFGSLENYLDEAYWKAHKTVEFHTLYEREKYDIIAVCLAKVEYQDEDVFRYYNFLNAENEEDFQQYKENLEELKVFSGELEMEYGDKLITLSTCNNYIEDGRLFLVAKKIN